MLNKLLKIKERFKAIEEQLNERIREKYIKTTYTPNGTWKTSCWVNTLKKLEELENNKDVLDARCCRFVWGSDKNMGHAWIEYDIIEGDKIVSYAYDPTKDEEICNTKIKKEESK